jgi:hypothetical protein
MSQPKTSDRLHQSQATLGVKAGASLEDVSTTYYTLIKKFPVNPTEEDEERLQKVKSAYDYLRHAHAPARRKPLGAAAKRRILVSVTILLTVASLAGLVVMNYTAIKQSMTHYDKGAVLRFKNQSEPFGEVVTFDSHHQFPTGNPSPAYGFRTTGSEETVWVGQRLVVTGMIPI